MPQTIKILDMREFPSIDPKRIGKMDMMVSYLVDGVTSYVVQLKKEDYTEEKLKESIRKSLEERDKIVGKTFTV